MKYFKTKTGFCYFQSSELALVEGHTEIDEGEYNETVLKAQNALNAEVDALLDENQRRASMAADELRKLGLSTEAVQALTGL
jgi:hypothetical protein